MYTCLLREHNALQLPEGGSTSERRTLCRGCITLYGSSSTASIRMVPYATLRVLLPLQSCITSFVRPCYSPQNASPISTPHYSRFPSFPNAAAAKQWRCSGQRRTASSSPMEQAVRAPHIKLTTHGKLPTIVHA